MFKKINKEKKELEAVREVSASAFSVQETWLLLKYQRIYVLIIPKGLKYWFWLNENSGIFPKETVGFWLCYHSELREALSWIHLQG